MGRVGRAKKVSGASSDSTRDEKLIKRINLLIDRIEIILTEQLIDGAIDIDIPWGDMKAAVSSGTFIIERNFLEKAGSQEDAGNRFPLRHRGVNWAAVKRHIQQLTSFIELPAFTAYLDEEICFEEDRERSGLYEMLVAVKLQAFKNNNGLAMIQGKWRKEAYGDREYIPLIDYVVTDTVSVETEQSIQEQLRSSLPDGFHGPALNCGDQEETEQWMRQFSVDGVNRVDEDSIIRWQVNSCMEHLLGAVEDRVCNDIGVVTRDVIGLGPQLKEVPVWGIDCYTRRNIELILCESIGSKCNLSEEECYNNNTIVSQAQDYIEQFLLPTINMQSPEVAHDLSCSLGTLIKVRTVV